MNVRLPRGVIYGLLASGAVGATLSIYLDEYQLKFLQDHPIWANWLSTFVAFCFGLPFVTTVIGRRVESGVHEDGSRRIVRAASAAATALGGRDPSPGEAANVVQAEDRWPELQDALRHLTRLREMPIVLHEVRRFMNDVKDAGSAPSWWPAKHVLDYMVEEIGLCVANCQRDMTYGAAIDLLQTIELASAVLTGRVDAPQHVIQTFFRYQVRPLRPNQN